MNIDDKITSMIERNKKMAWDVLCSFTNTRKGNIGSLQEIATFDSFNHLTSKYPIVLCLIDEAVSSKIQQKFVVSKRMIKELNSLQHYNGEINMDIRVVEELRYLNSNIDFEFFQELTSQKRVLLNQDDVSQFSFLKSNKKMSTRQGTLNPARTPMTVADNSVGSEMCIDQVSSRNASLLHNIESERFIRKRDSFSAILSKRRLEEHSSSSSVAANDNSDNRIIPNLFQQSLMTIKSLVSHVSYNSRYNSFTPETPTSHPGTLDTPFYDYMILSDLKTKYLGNLLRGLLVRRMGWALSRLQRSKGRLGESLRQSKGGMERESFKVVCVFRKSNLSSSVGSKNNDRLGVSNRYSSQVAPTNVPVRHNHNYNHHNTGEDGLVRAATMAGLINVTVNRSIRKSKTSAFDALQSVSEVQRAKIRTKECVEQLLRKMIVRESKEVFGGVSRQGVKRSALARIVERRTRLKVRRCLVVLRMYTDSERDKDFDSKRRLQLDKVIRPESRKDKSHRSIDLSDIDRKLSLVYNIKTNLPDKK